MVERPFSAPCGSTPHPDRTPRPRRLTSAAGRNSSGYRLLIDRSRVRIPPGASPCSGSSVAEQFPVCVHHDRSSAHPHGNPAAGRSRTVLGRAPGASREVAGSSPARPPRRPVAQSARAVRRRHDRSDTSIEEGRDVLPAAVRAAPPTRSRRVRRRPASTRTSGSTGRASTATRTSASSSRTRRRRRRRHNRDLRLTLRIADCANTINLEFSLDSPELRENSLFKIDTLLDALHRFRDGSRRGGGARRAARPLTTTRRCTMSYLKRHGTRRVPQWAPLPGQVAN